MKFEKLTEEYKSLVLHWLSQPHVTKFYYGDGLKNTISNIELYCQGINNNGHYYFDHWLAFYQNRPFAFLMTSPITGPYDSHHDYNEWYQSGKKTFTLDFLIGNCDFLGRGLAHRTIQRFILDKYHDADFFMIDPEESNTKAIHVYEKSGFKKVKQFFPNYNPKAHVMMRLVVSELKLSGITEDMRIFVNNVKNIWGEKAERWLKQLPYHIKQLRDHWSLTDITPVNNMSYNYVARAIQKKQKLVVLKVSCDKTLIEDEYKALKHFDGAGSVKALAINPNQNAILIEQAVPGNTLETDLNVNMTETMRIYADVVRKIASKPLSNFHYRHTEEWCKAIDRIKTDDIQKNLVKKALEIRSFLLSSAQDTHLCHGDLHLGNVLKHQKNWISIDPKGIMGEIAFEASAFNFIKKNEWQHPDSIKDTAISRSNQLANILKIDKTRLLRWIFLREIISAQWFIEDRGNPEKAIQLASSIINEI